MKSTGIVRSVDSVGRFVIPMELRRTLGIVNSESSIEVFIDDDKIILRKYSPSCIFCKSCDDIIEVNEQKVCRECAQKIAAAISAEE